MLNDALLRDYIGKFYGYGRWDAPFWFIGMEEACFFTVKHINDRLETWRKRGKNTLESMEQFAEAVPLAWHGDQSRPQSTWGKLIRVLLTAQGRAGRELSDRILLDYQRAAFGTHAGETCLPELFPLPSPGIKHWFYGRYSNIPFLQTRLFYSEHLRESRIQFLADRIRQNPPRVVVFYGKTYSEDWKQIAGVQFTPYPDVSAAKANDTCFYIMQHPKFYSDDQLDSIGYFIAARRGGGERQKHSLKFQRAFRAL